MSNLISKEQVKKLGELCMLELSEADITKLSTMFSDTLKYIETLNELDIAEVPETFQVTGLTNVFQQSVGAVTIANTLSKDEVIANTHELIKGLIATNAVFDRNSSA